MACPKCGCKVCYEFDRGDEDQPADDNMERCAACGHMFDIEDHADEDEDEPS